MSTLYLNLSLGAAGDMITAALYQLLDEKQQIEFVNTMNRAGIPGVKINPQLVNKYGVNGCHMQVTVDGVEEGVSDSHHHNHTTLSSISEIINSLNLPQGVKDNTKSIYSIIANAESEVHKEKVELVHFHEVGAMDAVADVAAVGLIINMLSPNSIVATPITTGYGTVNCAHGVLPVPAPATAVILKDIPNVKGDIKGELCTPTGVAIAKNFINKFCADLPEGEHCGYGIGGKDFGSPTYVKAFTL